MCTLSVGRWAEVSIDDGWVIHLDSQIWSVDGKYSKSFRNGWFKQQDYSEQVAAKKADISLSCWWRLILNIILNRNVITRQRSVCVKCWGENNRTWIFISFLSTLSDLFSITLHRCSHPFFPSIFYSHSYKSMWEPVLVKLLEKSNQ